MPNKQIEWHLGISVAPYIKGQASQGTQAPWIVTLSSCASFLIFCGVHYVMWIRTPGNSREALIPKIGVLSGRLCAKFVRMEPGLPFDFRNLSGHVGHFFAQKCPDRRIWPQRWLKRR